MFAEKFDVVMITAAVLEYKPEGLGLYVRSGHDYRPVIRAFCTNASRVSIRI